MKNNGRGSIRNKTSELGAKGRERKKHIGRQEEQKHHLEGSNNNKSGKRRNAHLQRWEMEVKEVQW